MGTYQVTAKINDVPGKCVVKCSFNGRPSERYEIDSLDPVEIDRVLQEAADNLEIKVSEDQVKIAEADAIKVENGKIVSK